MDSEETRVNPEDVSLGEVARGINRLENAVREQTAALTEEVRSVRHRVNNIEAMREGDRVRLSNIERAAAKLEESQTWAFRLMAGAFLMIVIEGLVLYVRTGT